MDDIMDDLSLPYMTTTEAIKDLLRRIGVLSNKVASLEQRIVRAESVTGRQRAGEQDYNYGYE